MAKSNPKLPSVTCTACEGDGIGGGEYVPELCGEGEDTECQACKGRGTVNLPYFFEVCPQCEGSGTSSAYLGAYTASEWAEQDDEFKEDYIAGRYDRTCQTCNGLRVVAEVDREQCPADLLKRWDEAEAFDAECRRTQRMESDSGCSF